MIQGSTIVYKCVMRINHGRGVCLGNRKCAKKIEKTVSYYIHWVKNYYFQQINICICISATIGEYVYCPTAEFL